MSKHPNGIGIYDLDDNLISKFKNNIELAPGRLRRYGASQRPFRPRDAKSFKYI